MLEAGLQPIPGHRLLRRLGVGAFSEVWEAVTADGGSVALKFLDARSRYGHMIRGEVRMLQALAELRHPGIIAFHGVAAHARYIVLSMEKADGNLAELHRLYQDDYGTHIPRSHALELLEPVAEALDFLRQARVPGLNESSRGVQHCDIKPANLLLVGDRLKVGDFGLCAATVGRTHLGGGWRGTPPYAAPELYRGIPSERTDQYALAVTWCELVEGETVFTHAPMPEVGHPQPPVDLVRLPPDEAVVLARALHPQPATRWPSCGAFLEALCAAQSTVRI
jgi:serine/threonine protein kinase